MAATTLTAITPSRDAETAYAMTGITTHTQLAIAYPRDGKMLIHIINAKDNTTQCVINVNDVVEIS